MGEQIARPERMSDLRYQATQAQLVGLAQILLVSDIDFDGFLDRISVALNVGPVLDPTLYMRGNARLEAIRDFAFAMKKATGAARQLSETIERTTEVNRG